MKTNQFTPGSLCALFVLVALPLGAAETWIRYDALPTGSLVKLDGTSSLHDWTVECRLVAGRAEFDPAFNLDQPAPGKVNARLEVMIPVRQLKSGKSGMDTVMYDALKQSLQPRIFYRLTDISGKEAPRASGEPFVLDAKGELAVSGVTNKVDMAVTVTHAGKDRLKFSGATAVKMTSFGIEPPSPRGTFGLISTGDDVKITFEWLTEKNPDPK